MERCSICLENIETSEECILKCEHVFHLLCIKKYILERRIRNMTNLKCPLCRNTDSLLIKNLNHEDGNHYILQVLQDKFENWCIVSSFNPQTCELFYAKNEHDRKSMYDDNVCCIYNKITNQYYPENIQKRSKDIL